MQKWTKINKSNWCLKEGVEINNYGHKTRYPFINIHKSYNTKLGIYDKGYNVHLITTHQTHELKTNIPHRGAIKFIYKYMLNN